MNTSFIRSTNFASRLSLGASGQPVAALLYPCSRRLCATAAAEPPSSHHLPTS